MSRTSRRRHRLRPAATEPGRSSRGRLSALVAGAVALALPLGVLAGAAVSREALEGAGAAVVVETLDEIADALTGVAGA